MGILYAVVAGACLALQGAANSRIGQAIGTWQAAAMTQFAGFALSLAILAMSRDGGWRSLRRAKPLYLAGGAFAAPIIFCNVTAMHRIGAALTIAAVLISQLGLTFVVEKRGWLGLEKRRTHPAEWAGIAMMIAGVAILRG